MSASPSNKGQRQVTHSVCDANNLVGNRPAGLEKLTSITRLSLHDNIALSGPLPSGFTSIGGLQRLAVANTGLCARDTEAFRDWLDTVPDKPGGVRSCQ